MPLKAVKKVGNTRKRVEKRLGALKRSLGRCPLFRRAFRAGVANRGQHLVDFGDGFVRRNTGRRILAGNVEGVRIARGLSFVPSIDIAFRLSPLPSITIWTAMIVLPDCWWLRISIKYLAEVTKFQDFVSTAAYPRASLCRRGLIAINDPQA